MNIKSQQTIEVSIGLSQTEATLLMNYLQNNPIKKEQKDLFALRTSLFALLQIQLNQHD